MTSTADRTIAALRANHDQLAKLAGGLTPEQLDAPSGASEWPVAQVFSHLGSGAEIGLASLQVATEGAAAPADGFNEGVWDRWNAMSPQAQADGFVEHSERLVSAYEAISPDDRESLTVKLGFVPFPLSLAAYAGMRLNEAANHSWDIRVAFDDAAAISQEEAELLAGFLSSELAFLIGFIGKADQLGTPAVVALADSGYSLTIDDGVTLGTADGKPTATFTGPLESVTRLISGRLTAAHTPATVEVSGNLDLDDLRKVFPGY